MKHNLKRLESLILAVALVLSLGTMMAFAADPVKGSIEITSPITDPNADKTTYEAYKIFDMTTTTDGETDTDGKFKKVSYTINSAWADFFKTGAPGADYLIPEASATDPDKNSLNQITVDGAKYYINITDGNVAEFAKKAFEYAQKTPTVAPTVSKEVAKGATEVKFTDLDLGYYMVYPKGASVNVGSYTSIVSLTNTEPDGKISQKAEYPKMTKTADDISTEVGQKVTYTLKSNVPDTTGYSKYEFTFKDKTSEGLTYDGNGTVTVKIGGATLTAGTDYTFAATPADGNDFELTINLLKEVEPATDPKTYTNKYDYGKEIEIKYTATVNDNAVTKIDKNHATLTYNNDPKDSSKKETTPPVEVKTYSSKIVIDKIDGKDATKKLKDAKFVLRVKTLGGQTGDSHESDIAVGKYYFCDATGKVQWVEVAADKQKPADLAANTAITVVTTDTNGAAEFKGLEDGTYELIEVVAPDGYNLLTAPVDVVVAGSDADTTTLTKTVEVKNNSGTQLPSTGGIGTTIFYVVGGILVIGAGVVLFTRKRMSKDA